MLFMDSNFMRELMQLEFTRRAADRQRRLAQREADSETVPPEMPASIPVEPAPPASRVRNALQGCRGFLFRTR